MPDREIGNRIAPRTKEKTIELKPLVGGQTTAQWRADWMHRKQNAQDIVEVKSSGRGYGA